tara:strand:+ start:1065 stop:1544 length:480 start_codon:yes stop_codon:yes gene_type:complete
MIEKFDEDFAFLSNFWPCDIEFEGIVFPSTEHAFQAAKTNDRETRLIIAAKKTPGQAKRAGGRQGILPDFDFEAWEDKKIDVMGEICRIKFQDPALRELLKATGSQKLQEGNNWNDTFWGVSLKTGKGRNVLGTILEIIRDEISAEDEPGDCSDGNGLD